jgi:hypothetical protein
MRVLAVCAAICLIAHPALAADPKIDSAVKTFKAVATDAGKLKTFCDMSKAMDTAGDNPTPADQAKVEGFMKQLGPEFAAAWTAGESADPNSDDGKVWSAALDDLSDKCP